MTSVDGAVFPETPAAGLPTLRVKSSRKRADASSEWKCLPCKKHFSSKYRLRVHNEQCIRNGLNPRGSVNSSNKVKEKHTCPECSKSYVGKKFLEYHIKSFHPTLPTVTVFEVGTICQIPNEATIKNVDANLPSITVTSRQRHTCPICSKSYVKKNYLVHHITTVHPAVEVDTICHIPRGLTLKKVMRCPVCLAWNRTMSGLSDHIRDTHAEIQIPGVLFFDTVEEFKTWKHDEETRTVTGFNKRHGSANKSIEHYYCRRSGRFKSQSSQKRRMKMQGSCRAGSECPASITTIATPRGIMILYSSIHIGHNKEVKHTVLSQIDKERLARRISMGINYDEILDKVRGSLTKSAKVSRLHFLQHKDLNNIARDFHLTKVHRKNAAESVRVWVEMCRQERSEIVRFVKFQGAEDVSQNGRIALDDFMIVLMNDVQVHMLQKYGPNRVISLDSTLGTITYNFQLTTLLVIDDHGEGFPVAFCISNKVDTLAIEVFLEHVRKAVGGPVNGVVLMTDDSQVYVNAWRTVMGLPNHHILCTWHIDRRWKKNLSKIKRSTEVKAELYQMLRALREADNMEEFRSSLDSSLRYMEAVEGMSKFVSYFRREYVARPEMWAYSYRRGLHHIHTVHLEAFHLALKHIFVPETKVKSLDLSLNALLRLLRFETFDRVLKQEGCELNRYISDIRERHTFYGLLEREQIDVCENQNWLVHGEREDYTVIRASPEEISRLHSSTARLCLLVCDICNVCVHTLSCTCMDYQLRNTVCRHIHAVVQLCGIDTAVEENSETCTVEDVGHLPKQEIEFDNELDNSSVDTYPPESPQKEEEMSILSEAECESLNDGEKCLREFDTLIDTIRGFVIGEVNLGVVAVANEGLKTVVAQMTAARLQSIQSVALPGVYLDEVTDMETNEAVATKNGRRNVTRNKKGKQRKNIPFKRSKLIA